MTLVLWVLAILFVLLYALASLGLLGLVWLMIRTEKGKGPLVPLPPWLEEAIDES